MRQIGFGRMKMLSRATPTSSENQTATEFEDLAMPLVSSAYNLARWLLQNDNDAEDLVQETYLKAFQNFRSFHSGTNFRAWILRILRNTFLTSRSTLERRMTVALDWEEDLPQLHTDCASPESLLIKKLNIAAIRDAIEQLPFSYREVILLSDVEGLTYREIAEITEIPIGTVMSRLARARKAVRDALRPTETEHHRQPNSALEEAGRQTPCAHQRRLYV
jgi:RNA polymerase sigma factor (sigma-70 family)